ncbi:unnamed protein product, partial [Tilletia controversa]
TALALSPSLDSSTSSALRSRLIAAPSGTPSERETLKYAFIDARLITSERHLRTGLHQALLAVSKGVGSEVEGGMKTKTVRSEVIFALHPSGNIGESIRKFGIAATTTSLLLLRVGPSSVSSQSILDHMSTSDFPRDGSASGHRFHSQVVSTSVCFPLADANSQHSAEARHSSKLRRISIRLAIPSRDY